jgi:hypothetical protein
MREIPWVFSPWVESHAIYYFDTKINIRNYTDNFFCKVLKKLHRLLNAVIFAATNHSK